MTLFPIKKLDVSITGGDIKIYFALSEKYIKILDIMP